MALFDSLPAELVLKVATYCRSMPTLLAMARTCRAAHAMLLSESDCAAYAEGLLRLNSQQLCLVAALRCKVQSAKLARVRSLQVTEPSVLDHAIHRDHDCESDSDNGRDDSSEKQTQSPSDRRDSACDFVATDHPVPTHSTPLATWAAPTLHMTFASLPLLTSLNLSRTSLTSVALHIILPLVPRVTHLSIAQCPGITASAANTLARHPSPFISLDLSWTRVHGALAIVLESGVLDNVRQLKLVGLIGIPGHMLVQRTSCTIRELDLGYSAGVSSRDLLALAAHAKERTTGGKVSVNVDRCMGGGGMVDSRVILQVHERGAGRIEVSGWQPPTTWQPGAWKGAVAAGLRSEAVFSPPRVAVAVYMARRDTVMASPAV